MHWLGSDEWAIGLDVTGRFIASSLKCWMNQNPSNLRPMPFSLGVLVSGTDGWCVVGLHRFSESRQK